MAQKIQKTLDDPLSQSSPTLTSLPSEILSQIASYCTRETALSLAQTTAYITPCVQGRLWRNLNVSVSAQGLRRSTGPGSNWFEQADLHKAAIQDKLALVLAQGNGRCWRMVETLRLCPGPGSAKDMAYLLGCVSANLRRLTLESATDFGTYRASDIENLDLHLTKLSLPSLTHLELESGTLSFAPTLAIFCNAAPSLVFLDIAIHPDISAREAIPKTTSMHTCTRLREIRIACDLIESDDPETLASIGPILDLLKCSPNVMSLTLCFNTYTAFAAAVLPCIIDVIAKQEMLGELHFAASAKYIADAGRMKSHGEAFFPALKYVIFETGENPTIDFFQYPVVCPNLEMMIFDGSPFSDYDIPKRTSPKFNIRSSGTQGMTPQFAEQICESPRLRVISYDPSRFADLRGSDAFAWLGQLDYAKALTGSVSSYIIDGRELLHVRMFLKIQEYADVAAEEQAWDERVDPETTTMIRYEDDEGEDRYKKFKYIKKAMWFDFTDYGGGLVPAEIIEQMRLVNGATVDQWEQRQVEVGDSAEEVFFKWMRRNEA